ncbi:HAAAP family serine/threonine permease [Pseudomonas protegens]|jgi:serine transporter|uniref:serine/threonine transporter n=1 Tax=Pseudomonas TaxID=286 RepID=UPI0008071025|nr:serine/threonine transporter [Pseudomonas protegens]MCU1766655.1 serine/threonine transporter [Pseudomonas protegens]OBZ25224.1 HAAAP family serine/threonine permease [Pseudomonas protegens]OBZ31662.1 HAAAP family serine/threonine permease [Pseudomonas protegens]OKK42539.1 HAAAP family serine/threonine permease [Pseudomonas protegens]OKK46645.1 HAAAP family serine/threonine permease [Pseudomonas protegens]
MTDVPTPAAQTPAVATPRDTTSARQGWSKHDTTWMLGLYGTAIGAGTLFLPINAGVGGFWPLIVLALLAFPMTFFAHRGLTRFVLSGRSGDITEVVEEHFGVGAGKLITLLYFFAIFPILLVYSVALTNTLSSFMEHQLHMTPPPRALLSLLLILGLMAIVRCGQGVIVRAMSLLVYPFVAALLLLALSLIPNWNGAFFASAGEGMPLPLFFKTLWLAIPVMVFSFNHSPIISAFALDQKRHYGPQAEAKSSGILATAHGMMVLTVMFFCFSCVLALSPADLVAAKEQNISILSYLANHFQTPVIAYAAPLIALVAITKSFLGHYIGASEGFQGLIVKNLRGRSLSSSSLEKITALFMILTCWAVATFNPSILRIIETMGGPVIACLLFLMPMYAIRRVPSLRQYSGQLSNLFVVLIGLVALSAIIYSVVP